MEQILDFQENMKNKIKEKLQEKLKNEITQKEEEIEKIKSKYENQEHKEGLFVKSHIQDVKNKDASKSLFCFFYLSPLSFIISISLIIFSFSLLVKDLNFIMFFLFFTFNLLLSALFVSSIFAMIWIIIDLIHNGLNAKTELTKEFEKLKEQLRYLNQKLSDVDLNMEAYIKNTVEDHLNKYDIIDIADNIILSKDELFEISKILSKEDLFHLSIVAINKNKKDDDNIIKLKYQDVINFIKFKQENNIEDVSKLMFNV